MQAPVARGAEKDNDHAEREGQDIEAEQQVRHQLLLLLEYWHGAGHAQVPRGRPHRRGQGAPVPLLRRGGP